MGNLSDSEKKTNSLLYIESLENSYLNESMIEEMLDRWREMGKPLFMIPKDFRDRVLLNIDQEVKLNYLKWLTQSLDIDIMEVMTMLIVFSRCDLQIRLKLLFQLFCFNKNMTMNRKELTFMLNKISASIAQTYQIKKIIMLHQVDKFLD